MNIVFNPPENEENSYIGILVNALKEAQFTVYPLDNLLSSYRHFKSVKLIHLNWFENVDDSSLIKACTSFFRKLVVLTAIKLGRKKLIWTMHNRASHEKGLSIFSRILTRLLIRWADLIIIHSWESKAILEKQDQHISAKVHYLPHPDFIGIYGPKLPIKKADPGYLRLLFIGTVKPYKNIELLIELVKEFHSSIHLTIAGKPYPPHYKQTLEALAQSAENITLKLTFIPNEELPILFEQADLLALPYDLASSLNSGTVILAFSYGKTVICPAIGTITDLQDMRDHVLSYNYQTTEDHKVKLRQKMQEALQLKQKDSNVFDRKGQYLYTYVGDKHNKQAVGQELARLYTTLLTPAKP